MPLFIKPLNHYAAHPTRDSEQSAGLVLYASEARVISHGRRHWVPTGLAVGIDPYMVGQIWPLDDLAKIGVDIAAGVINSNDRGELKVLMVNNTKDKSDLVVNIGDRIAQLMIVPVAKPTLSVVDEFQDVRNQQISD